MVKSVCTSVKTFPCELCISVQLHLPSELHSNGPVGHWSCDWWWRHRTDDPPEYTSLPGPHPGLQGGLVSKHTHGHTAGDWWSLNWGGQACGHDWSVISGMVSNTPNTWLPGVWCHSIYAILVIFMSRSPVSSLHWHTHTSDVRVDT